MNLSQTFDALFGRQHIAVAKITGDKGGGAWSATTQAGVAITLTGQAQIGQTVFYDVVSNKITGPAPDLVVTDMPI